SHEVSNEFNGSIGINMLAADIYAMIPISERISFQIAGRRSITDFFTTPTYKQYFKRIFQDSDLNNPNETVITNSENFYFYDISSKLVYDVSKKDKIEISFLSIDNALDYQETANINNTSSLSHSQLNQGSLAINNKYT